MAKKRGLGRGLDALLGATREAAPDIPLTPEQAAAASIRRLPVEQIQRGRYQPRRHFDEDKLRELADSIAAQGMVCLLYTSPSPRDDNRSRMPSSA